MLTPKINNIIILNSYINHWLSSFFLVYFAQKHLTAKTTQSCLTASVTIFPLATHCGVLLSPTHTPLPPTVSVRVSVLFWSSSQSLTACPSPLNYTWQSDHIESHTHTHPRIYMASLAGDFTLTNSHRGVLARAEAAVTMPGCWHRVCETVKTVFWKLLCGF